MKESRHSNKNLSIKCECTIFHNNIQLNAKKKSKLSTLNLLTQPHILHILPKAQSEIYEFNVHRLKVIHKKFIEEGKITLEFDGCFIKENQSAQPRKEILTHSINDSQPKQEKILIKQRYLDGTCQVFINNGSMNNLELLVKLMVEIKKKFMETNKPNSHQKQNQSDNKINLQQEKKQRFVSSIKKQQEKIPTRKDLVHLIKTFNKPQLKQKPTASKNHSEVRPKTILLNLPKILIKQIFSYSGVHLDYRLISKELQQFILMNIQSIRLKDEVEQETFNKLAKYALNVSCRMKQVKNLSLADRYEDKQLVANRAKNLDFGNWKEISAKNLNQLKGLRIYCLSMTYGIKFDFSNIYGIRLVELRLKGCNVSVRNSYIKEEHILYMLNNLNDLCVLQIPYLSTKVLMEIKNPKKIRQLKIGTLNIIHSPQKWQDLSKFTKLQHLQIGAYQKSGLSDASTPYNILWPEHLQTLEIGISLVKESLRQIPSYVKNLKINGQYYRNQHIEQIYLPSLGYLDISQAPNLSAFMLELFHNIKVVSGWDRSNVDYANNYYADKNIRIASTKCYTIYN